MMDKPEPFCIQPHDQFAVQVISYWLGLAEYSGVNQTKIVKAKAHLDTIIEWRNENHDKVKVPD